jgi:hypothetical protein
MEDRCSAHTLSGEQCKLKSKEGGKCSRHSGEPCSICWGPMNANNSKKLDNCVHLYHTKCIEKWKKKNNTCPQCRTPIILTTYKITLNIAPIGTHAEITSNNVSMINTLFGIEANLQDYVTEIQFASQVEDDIRHILQEIGFPVTTFPARTQ